MVVVVMIIITLTVSRTVMAPKISSIAATLLLWCISVHTLYSMSDLYFNMLYICLCSVREQSSVCLWCVNGGHGSANLQLPIRFCPTHIYHFWFFFSEMQPPQFIEKFYITQQKNFVFGILVLNNALNCDAATHTSEILQLQVKLSLC